MDVVLFCMNITINVLFSLTEQEAISLHYRLSSIGTFVVMYPLEGMTSSKIDDLLRTTSAYIYDHTSLNFTVLCRLEKCLPFLSEVKEKYLCIDFIIFLFLVF